MLKQVDRNANPPVCKIMDYHKEMYKKKESDKERAKSKVRFAIGAREYEEAKKALKEALRMTNRVELHDIASHLK
jgi:translation initiation factor IF-3